MSNFFYHSHIRNLIKIFGSLFSDVKVVRFDRDKTIKEIINPVPIEYSNRDKFLTRLEKQPQDDGELSTRYHVAYPRLAFEMLGISYSADRAKNSNQSLAMKISDSRGMAIDAPVPYDVNFDLYIVAKNATDANQMIEQILPRFKPQMNIRIKNMPLENDVYNLAIKLDSVSMEDNYEGDFSETRFVLYTLGFTIPYHFFGAVGSDLEREVVKILHKEDTGNTLTDEEVDDQISANKPLINTIDIRTLNTSTDIYNPDNTELIFRIDANE